MFVSKLLVCSIHFCCVIKCSFSSLNFNLHKDNALLLRNYSANLHEKCQKTFAKEGDITAGIDNEKTTKWNSPNGSTQAKFYKMSLFSTPFSKRVYSLTEENENTVLNSKVQPRHRLLVSTQKNVDKKSKFFVITAMFNPASFKSRYSLYHKFAKHMNDTGAQLITIECIFSSLNQTKFEVTKPNNPWHIQLKSESVYWMKENLINIAVSRLPPHAKWIGWLDADIEFEETNWVGQTIKQLKKYTVVQVFEKAKFLGPSPKKEILRVDYSFGYVAKHHKPLNIGTFETWYPHPGYGWAMSVNDFREIRGLPVYNIDGSADQIFAYSLLNRISESFSSNELKLRSSFLHLISESANQTFKTLRKISKTNYKPIVGYVPITIRHHWHGSRKDRQYGERWKIFKDNDFDFKNDISVNEDGLFQLTQTKPKLQKDLLTFFQMRYEDEIVTKYQDTKMCKVGFFYEGERQRKIQ